jgi:hypothetical protein
MVSPFPIKMHYGAFDKGNAEKQILIMSLQYILRLLLWEKRSNSRRDDEEFTILICVVGREPLRFHFTNVLEILLHYSRRINVHIYAQDSIVQFDILENLQSTYRNQLFFHSMKSPAGAGTIIKKDKLNEALFLEKGNAIILIDLDNVQIEHSDITCKTLTI